MGVTYLLDTHTFVWLLTEPERLPNSALSVLKDPSMPVLVSAASAMEVATKARLGKFQAASVLVETWATHVASIGAADLPVSTRHALLAGQLQWDHRDPFDRLLAAQALLDNLTLVTGDAQLLALPGLRVMRV